MRDVNKGMPFLDEMGENLIAAELLFNSLTLKHGTYQHAQDRRVA